MSDKNKLFWAIMIWVIVIAMVVVAFNKTSGIKESKLTIDTAVANAKSIYRKRLLDGVDQSNGPCLSNDLMQGWAADLVHNPRVALDDLPSNQCQAYLEGRASHFVELDLSGNVIRVR